MQEAKTWLPPLFSVLSLVQRCIKVFSLDTFVNTKKQQTEYPLLSGLFSGYPILKGSWRYLPLFPRWRAFGARRGRQVGKEAGVFFDGHAVWQWSCHLSIYFLLLVHCLSDWKSSARAFSACVARCFLQSCTLSSAFPLAIFPVNLFYISSTNHFLSKSS